MSMEFLSLSTGTHPETAGRSFQTNSIESLDAAYLLKASDFHCNYFS